MVNYPIRGLKYLLKMKRILDMDYFGLNLKIFKNCLCYRNQCKNLVGVAIFIRKRTKRTHIFGIKKWSRRPDLYADYDGTNSFSKF